MIIKPVIQFGVTELLHAANNYLQEAFSYLLQATMAGLHSYKQNTPNTTTSNSGGVKSCNQSKELFSHLTAELQVNITSNVHL